MYIAKIYILVLVRLKVWMYIIISDEYTMVSTYISFGNHTFLSGLWLDDTIIVTTFLEFKNSCRHKHSFNIGTTYENKL